MPVPGQGGKNRIGQLAQPGLDRCLVRYELGDVCGDGIAHSIGGSGL